MFLPVVPPSLPGWFQAHDHSWLDFNGSSSTISSLYEPNANLAAWSNALSGFENIVVFGYANRHIRCLFLLVSPVTLDQSTAFVDDATRVASDVVTDLVPASLMRTSRRCWCIKQSSPAAKAPVTPGYDQVTTYLRPKNGPIVERTYDWSQRSYDWSQRSWVIARGKSVATRSMVMFKT